MDMKQIHKKHNGAFKHFPCIASDALLLVNGILYYLLFFYVRLICNGALREVHTYTNI